MQGMDENLSPKTPQRTGQSLRYYWPVIAGLVLLALGFSVAALTEHLRPAQQVSAYTTYRHWQWWDAVTFPLFALGLCMTVYGVKTRLPRLFRGWMATWTRIHTNRRRVCLANRQN
jgi:hypothetical protein